MRQSLTATVCLLCLVVALGAGPGGLGLSEADTDAQAGDFGSPHSVEPTAPALAGVSPPDGSTSPTQTTDGVERLVRLTPAERQTTVAGLQAHANQSQTPLLDFATNATGVTVESRFWLANAVLVTVDTEQASIDDIESVSNVESVEEHAEIGLADARTDGRRLGGPGPTATLPFASPATLGQGRPTSAHATDGLTQIRAPTAWESYDTRGEGASVVVLDTGVDPDHPDIDLSAWAEFDGDGNRLDTAPQDHDASGHGTHVSGTVAGGNASGQYIGVAPAANLSHGAVLTNCGGACSGTISQILAGMEWAVESDADVLSMSFGAKGYYNDFVEPVRNAENTGTTVVSAIGNDGAGNSSSPGNVYNATSVGASNSNREIVAFSSGETIDTLDAWGADPNTLDWPNQYVVPSVAAPGADITSAVPGEDYTTKSGTSMATPHVAGALALAVSALPAERSPDELAAALESTARKPDDWSEPDDQRDSRYGSGIIDVPDTIEALGPSATFTVEPAAPLVDANATFDASGSIGNIDGYEWDFTGDGTSDATGAVVNRTFTEAGPTPVGLSVSEGSGETATANESVEVRLPPVAGGTSPRDPDGDGLYEDVRGDGDVGVFDVQTLFTNIDSPALSEYARYYNFQGDNEEQVTVFDVQSLFGEL